LKADPAVACVESGFKPDVPHLVESGFSRTFWALTDKSHKIKNLSELVQGWNISPGGGVLIRIEDRGYMRDPKDQLLLARLQQGEEHAIEELSNAYGHKIYQLAFRYLRNREDAEEVARAFC